MACETDRMRRLSGRWAGAAVAAVGLAAGLAAGPVAGPAAAGAVAQPSPTPGPEPAEPVPGESVCAIGDPRLVELSGLVAFDDGYAVVNDGTLFEDRAGVFLLDGSCQATEQIAYPTPPLDPEELAWDRESDALWVGDTGDNFEVTGQEPRPTVAFWRIDLGGDRTPVIHRFTYPDGQPRDAEALLLDADGTPIIISKSVSGAAELFRPEELRPSSGPDDTVALAAVGEVTLPDTETEHPLGAVARTVVTGAANAPDGSRVVLRSYTDAFEYDVTDGDVVAAVTTGEPRITPLPGEPQGEAIAYSPDGQRFLTVSEVPEGETGYTPEILSYAPAAPPEPEPPPEQAPAGSGGGGDGGGLFNDLQDFINLIIVVGVIGVLLVAAGVVGIVRARRNAAAAREDDLSGGDGAGAPATGRARLPAGAAGATAAAPAGLEPEPPAGAAAGVYGSSTAREDGTEYRGTEYGGGREYGGAGYAGSGYEYENGQYRGTQYGGAGYAGTEQGGSGYPQGGGYRDGGYPDGGYPDGGYPDGGYPDGGYGPAGYPAGPDYPAGSEYPGQPGYPDGAGGYGRAEYDGAGGAGQQYGPAGYPQGGHQEPYDQQWPNGYPEPDGRAPAGGAHHAGGADYYSDDPDYPYEFRDRGR
jgi:hypothetical protein